MITQLFARITANDLQLISYLLRDAAEDRQQRLPTDTPLTRRMIALSATFARLANEQSKQIEEA